MHEILLRETLTRAGLNPDKDAKLVRIDFFDMGTALSRGDIDAYLSGEPLPTLAKRQGYGEILAYPYYGEGIGAINSGMIVRRDFVEKNPERVMEMLRAHRKATEQCMSDKAFWLETSSKMFGVELDVLRDAADNMELVWDMDDTFMKQLSALGKRMLELGIIKKEDRPYLGAGVLAGMITIPIGCIVGGLVMNMTPYKMDIGRILINLVPVIVIAALIVIGLWFAPGPMINGFNKFGTGVTVVITVLTAIAVFQQITGIMFPVFDVMSTVDPDLGMTPLNNGLLVCGQIGIVLIGAFPMVEWITRTFGGALSKLGGALGMNDKGSAGLVATLANNIAMFNIMGEMNPKGKILNVAFAVSAAFVFGDHLGFAAGNDAQMIFPMIAGKLVAGVTALIVANLLAPKLLSKIQTISK